MRSEQLLSDIEMILLLLILNYFLHFHIVLYLHNISRSRMLGFLNMVATFGLIALPLLLLCPFLLALSVSWLQLLLLPPSLVLLNSSTMVSSSDRAGRHLDK